MLCRLSYTIFRLRLDQRLDLHLVLRVLGLLDLVGRSKVAERAKSVKVSVVSRKMSRGIGFIDMQERFYSRYHGLWKAYERNRRTRYTSFRR
jgi:hypothetical protein